MENEMTLAWVVENYLPDYKGKYDACHINKGTHEDKRIFIEHYFPEALTAFRDAVWREACEAQKAICADTVLDLENGGYCEVFTTEWRVRECDTPEPKNK
jgi:hypothetical protein